MSRRRTLFAQSNELPVIEAQKPLPGHWKQRVKLAQDMGADVTTDAEATAYLRRHGYGDVC